MSAEKGFHDAVFSGLEDVALPVVRHALPGPTWGDLLRDPLRFFSDEGRAEFLWMLERISCSINFEEDAAMHAVVDTLSNGVASGFGLMQVRPTKGSRQLSRMFWTGILLAAIRIINISGFVGTSQKPPC
jgi:hypothetical protein